MNIINKSGFVNIVDPNTNKTMYRIRKSLLGDTRDGNISEWITQLSGKMWVATTLLYQLALVIIEEFPDKSIDWKTTFFGVEKGVAINEAVDLDDSVKNSGVAQVMMMIKLGQQFMGDGTDDKIRKLVSSRLREYGIM